MKSTREVIELSLRDLGAAFHYAVDGLEGLQLAAELLPDLIVLDLALPKVSGDEVLKVLREDTLTKAIPVPVVTALGYGANDPRHRSRRLHGEAIPPR